MKKLLFLYIVGAELQENSLCKKLAGIKVTETEGLMLNVVFLMFFLACTAVEE